MRIGLLDVDGGKFPNLALMKLSAYHKSKQDTVETWMAIDTYDMVYRSKIFTFTPDIDVNNAEIVMSGGTGYDLDTRLRYQIEHIMPDYSIYNTNNTAYGFLTRGCPRHCGFCIVSDKEGLKSDKVADLGEWWSGQKKIVVMDPNILACRDHESLLQQLIGSKARVDINQGLDARFLTKDNIGLLNQIKIKRVRFAWDRMSQSDDILTGLERYATMGVNKQPWTRSVYVLTNYDTTTEEDLYRIYKIRDLGYDPYIMIYDKANASHEVKRMAGWVNNRSIWRVVDRYEDYGRV